MKNFLRHNGIWVLIIALLLTAAISIGSVFVPDLTGPAGRVLGALGTPFRAAATFVTDKIAAVRSGTSLSEKISMEMCSWSVRAAVRSMIYW